MPAPRSRRAFLKGKLAAGTALLAGDAVTHAQGTLQLTRKPARKLPPELAGLTTYQLGPRIWVRWDNEIVTCYRAHRSQKFPYLFPLAGPVTGLSLTTETSLPYPHHRSLYFACDRVNGGNYWQEGYDRGQILSGVPKVAAKTSNSIELTDSCDWQKPGGPVVMRDHRRIRISVHGSKTRFVDWDIEWIAVADVTVQKTNHSLFALRAAADLTPNGGGQLVNADGATGEKATFGRPSNWCAFYGQRRGVADGIIEGIAMMAHPANPWSPCPWFTRDYGFISPTPFNFRDQAWTLPAGESVRLRYRVVLFAGTPEEINLDEIGREWTS